MRHLAVAILLIAITTTAQTISTIYNLPDQVKTKIDEAAYHLVKNRGDTLRLPLALPGFAYGKHQNIRMIVVAIPYSPDNQSGVTNLVNTMTSLLVNRKWDDFANALASIRSVYYPYETFKIKLIFIMFINTQNLFDILQDTMRDLKSESKENASIPYVDNILRILRKKFDKWKKEEKDKLLNDLKNFDINDYRIDPDGDRLILKLSVVKGNKIGEVWIYFTYTYRDLGDGENKNCEVSIKSYSENPPRIYNSLENYLAGGLLTLAAKLDLSSDDLEKIFAGADVNDLTSDLNTAITNYVRTLADTISREYLDSKTGDSLFNIYVNVWKKLQGQYSETYTVSCNNQLVRDLLVRDLFDKLLNKYIEIDDKNKGTVLNLLKSKAKESLTTRFENSVTELINIFEQDFKVIDNVYDELLNGIKDSFKENKDEIEKDITNIVGKDFGQFVTGCVENYLSNVAQKSIGAAVSTIPGANVVLTILNGVVGGLSKIVTINGEIYTESHVLDNTFKGITVFNTTNRAACRGDRLPVRSSFVSYPDLTEATIAFLLGAASGIAKMFWSGAGEVIDMVPIVRVVDLPYPGYYFAMPAVPGIYKIEIKVGAQSIIDGFIEGAKEKIKEQLNKIADKYNNGLAKVVKETVSEKIQNLLGTGENIDLISNAFDPNSGTKPNIDEGFDKGYLRLSVYLVSVPPYVYGGRSGDVFNYSLSYDIWGVIRANLASHAAKVNNYIQNMCSNQQSGGGSKPASQPQPQISLDAFGKLQGFCTAKLQELFQRNILNNVLEPLDNVLKNKLETSENIQCSLEGVVESVGKQVVAQVVSTAKSKIEKKLNEVVGERICGSLVSAVKGSVENLVAKMLKDVSGVQQLADAIFTPEGSTAGGSQSGLPPAGSGDGGGGESIRVGVCSWNSVKFAKLYALKLYNSLVDALNVPSYFLSIKPITSMAESPTQRVCYGVVNVPYFVNTAMDSKGLSDEEKKSIILDSLDIIASDDTLRSSFNNFLRGKKIRTYIIEWSFHRFSVKLGKIDIDVLYEINGKTYYLCKVPSILHGIDPRSYLKDDLRSCEQMGLIIQRLTDVSGIDDLVGKLLELRSARRLVMPVATGYNVYFSAGKVYPVIRVTASGEKNPYYFVVPFATPAREFFVLGKVGDVVVFDGGGAVVDRPFYYIDVAR